MPRINERVNQTLSSATQSATYKYRVRKGHDILNFSVCEAGGGAFTSTLVLECSQPDAANWVTVTDGTYTNAEGSGTFVPGGNLDIRWNCTAYTDPVVVTIG